MTEFFLSLSSIVSPQFSQENSGQKGRETKREEVREREREKGREKGRERNLEVWEKREEARETIFVEEQKIPLFEKTRNREEEEPKCILEIRIAIKW